MTQRQEYEIQSQVDQELDAEEEGFVTKEGENIQLHCGRRCFALKNMEENWHGCGGWHGATKGNLLG